MAFRLALLAHVRAMGSHATNAALLDVQKRRERLQKRMDSWMTQAAAFLPDPDDDAEAPDSLDLDDDLEDPDEDVNPFMTAAEDTPPEAQRLPLPSSLAHPDSADASTADLREKEMLLRQGQANDALHNIRLALSHKAVLFRTSVRSARSQKGKTRAWAGIMSKQTALMQHARVYSSARSAMVRLGADEKLLERYRVLKSHHLKASTSIMDPAIDRHRNESLAWFWRMDAGERSMDDDWLEECVSHDFSSDRRHNDDIVLSLPCSLAPRESEDGSLARGVHSCSPRDGVVNQIFPRKVEQMASSQGTVGFTWEGLLRRPAAAYVGRVCSASICSLSKEGSQFSIELVSLVEYTVCMLWL